MCESREDCAVSIGGASPKILCMRTLAPIQPHCHQGTNPSQTPSRSLPPTRAQRGHNDQVTYWSNCHIVNVNVNEAGNFLKFHLCWFQIKPKQSDCYHWLYQRTTSSISSSPFPSISALESSPVHCCSPLAVELDLRTLSLQNKP